MIVDEWNFLTAVILIVTALLMLSGAAVYFYPSLRSLWRRQRRHYHAAHRGAHIPHRR